MISALYVESGGVYFDVEGVDPWSIDRDARKCSGPNKAICHPPCHRWGRYWGGGPSARVRRLLGDDGQCFAHSLWYVRTFGGVIEHPEASHAWRYYGLSRPPKSGGWVAADDFGGFTCCVEQGNYGHKARKATWLYVNNISLIELNWGEAKGKSRIDAGFHSADEAKAARADANYKAPKRLSPKELIDTPVEFRDLLISMCRRPA